MSKEFNLDDEFEKMKKNMSNEEYKGFMMFADVLIKTLAEKNPKAKLVYMVDENSKKMIEITDKIIEKGKSKENIDEIVEKYLNLLINTKKIYEDFEKEYLGGTYESDNK